jgi:homoserine O-acetyltransferase/O-succinyltransferase
VRYIRDVNPYMKRLSVVVAVLFTTVFSFAQEQKFADIGDFKLESGEVIRECRIGYRTFGKLNADKSNVILFPTWAGGTTEQLAGGNIGPGKIADTDKYYVIAVDALSNGVSTSPSNSTFQSRMKFPKITIRDMVNTQHHLLTNMLGITHVKAVMGISMGGMQTFEWMIAYPDFMDNAIPIVGTPRQDTYDMLHWQAQIDAITNDPAWKNGEYEENPARVANAQFGMLLLTTPENFNKTHTREQLAKELADAKNSPGQDCNNKIRQTEAMMTLDIAKHFGGSMEQAARAVKAKVLVIVATHDHVVTPGPAREFAKLLDAPVVELTGECGHQAPGCEEVKVKAAIEHTLTWADEFIHTIAK